MDYIIHGDQKTESTQKFMHEEVNVKCMRTKFGGHVLFSFRDLAHFLPECSLWVPLV